MTKIAWQLLSPLRSSAGPQFWPFRARGGGGGSFAYRSFRFSGDPVGKLFTVYTQTRQTTAPPPPKSSGTAEETIRTRYVMYLRYNVVISLPHGDPENWRRKTLCSRRRRPTWKIFVRQTTSPETRRKAARFRTEIPISRERDVPVFGARFIRRFSPRVGKLFDVKEPKKKKNEIFFHGLNEKYYVLAKSFIGLPNPFQWLLNVY